MIDALGPLALFGVVGLIFIAVKAVRWSTRRQIERYGQTWESKLDDDLLN